MIDRLLHVDTRPSTAALSVVEEEAKGGPADGLLNVGVVANDLYKQNLGTEYPSSKEAAYVRRLSAKLQSHFFQIGIGSRLHN